MLQERAPKAGALSAEEALTWWTLRYFRSHGPAQPKDFAWWSGLTLREAQRGLEMMDGQLQRETIDGSTYWLSPSTAPGKLKAPEALLLSIYDEYTIAYRDRSALDAERHIERLISMGNALTSVLVLDGKIAGTWKRVLAKSRVEVTASPFVKLLKAEKEAIEAAAAGYAAFLGLPLSLRFA